MQPPAPGGPGLPQDSHLGPVLTLTTSCTLWPADTLLLVWRAGHARGSVSAAHTHVHLDTTYKTGPEINEEEPLAI